MRNSRFTEAQIVGVLREHEAGAKIVPLCRRHGITEMAVSRWKKEYGGLQVSEAKRLKALKAENRQVKPLVAEQALNLQVVKDLLGRDVVTFEGLSSREPSTRHSSVPPPSEVRSLWRNHFRRTSARRRD